MLNNTIEHVAKQPILYSYILMHPFATYIDAFPILQNEILIEQENLEYGDHEEVVHLLQKKLKNVSYYDDSIDSDFGVYTEHSLKKFQADHHIEPTGVANEETITALIQVETDGHLKRLKSLSDEVYPGLQGEDVKTIQEALQYFGYYYGEIDGIYGPLTEKALKIAESEHDVNFDYESPEEETEELIADDNNEQEIKEVNVDENEQEAVDNQENSDENIEENEQETEQNIEVKAENTSTNLNGVIELARSFIGTEYVWGGDSPSGFDCSGFIQYVFETEDIKLPRTVSDTWNSTKPVDSPSVGDLVFFETYQPGPSHMGIYLGDGKFIHAGSSNGVEISELSNSYWEERYLGANRVE